MPLTPPMLIWFGSRKRSKPSAKIALPRIVMPSIRNHGRSFPCFK